MGDHIEHACPRCGSYLCAEKCQTKQAQAAPGRSAREIIAAHANALDAELRAGGLGYRASGTIEQAILALRASPEAVGAGASEAEWACVRRDVLAQTCQQRDALAEDRDRAVEERDEARKTVSVMQAALVKASGECDALKADLAAARGEVERLNAAGRAAVQAMRGIYAHTGGAVHGLADAWDALMPWWSTPLERPTTPSSPTEQMICAWCGYIGLPPHKCPPPTGTNSSPATAMVALTQESMFAPITPAEYADRVCAFIRLLPPVVVAMPNKKGGS